MILHAPGDCIVAGLIVVKVTQERKVARRMKRPQVDLIADQVCQRAVEERGAGVVDEDRVARLKLHRLLKIIVAAVQSLAISGGLKNCVIGDRGLIQRTGAARQLAICVHSALELSGGFLIAALGKCLIAQGLSELAFNVWIGEVAFVQPGDLIVIVEQTITSLNAEMKRDDEMLPAFRAKGGTTAAVSIDGQVVRMLSLDVFNVAADADKAVALAEEANRLAPSAATSSTLIAALIFRASKDLRRSDPAFDEYSKKYDRSVGTTNLIALTASEPGPFQKKVTSHADILKVVGMLRAERERYPNGRACYEWALLKNIDADEAGKCAESIRKTGWLEVEQSISAQLMPASANEAMEAFWLMQIKGNAAAAQDLVRKVASLGIPMPVAQ